jgi:hypothetical protein
MLIVSLQLMLVNRAMLRLTTLKLCDAKKTCVKKALACFSLMLLLVLSLTPYVVSPTVNAQIPQQPHNCTIPNLTGVAANGNDGHLPQNTLDNNANTRWSNFGFPSSIQYDLGTSQPICDVDIAWYRGNLRVNTFTISASDDQSFTNPQVIFTGQSSGKTTFQEVYDVQDTSARFLRITVIDNSENGWASVTEVGINEKTSLPQQQQPVTVGIAGDHDNGSELERTINNMKNHGVELALLPGDFSYRSCSSVDSWWSKWQSMSAQKYGALGNHDTGCRDQYLSKFKSSAGPGQPQDSWTYSRDWNGIHFISLNTEDGSGASSEQQNFVRNDLQQASQNPNVKWIFVMFHKQMKSSSASPNHAAIPALWHAYSSLFSQYGVDLVLQAHMHNYERLKPSGFQRAECSNFNNFPESCGPSYSVIGTGGRGLYNFEEIHPESLVRYIGHGYLNLDIVNNGNTLKGSFFGNDGSVRDTFTITKSGTTPQPTPTPIPQPGPSTIDQERALQFIKNSYNSQVGLLREAPCCNVYWLWNDNLLGQMALKHIDPELAAQVEAKMNSFDVPMRTPWATLDPQYRNSFSVRGSSEPTISTSPFVIRYSDYGGSNTLYCNNYADIAFLSAIHYFYLGNNELARMCYDAGKSTWDGTGMKDSGSLTGDYAVYKTALGLLAQKITGFAPIGIPSDYFSKFQASNGGITTDIIGGRPAGSQNIETTAAVLFALNPNLLQEPTQVPIPSPVPTSTPTPVPMYHYEPYLTLSGSNSQYTLSSSSLQLSQFSVAAWFKTTNNFGSNAYIVNKGGSGSDSSGRNMNYGIWMTGSERIGAGFETRSGSDIIATTPVSYNDGKWHYVVVTYGGSTVRIYVDGVQVATKSTSGAIPDNTGTQPVRVGANSLALNGYFTGNVDEVRIWNRALTTQEVSDAYNDGIFIINGQVLYSNFD